MSARTYAKTQYRPCQHGKKHKIKIGGIGSHTANMTQIKQSNEKDK